MSSVNQLNWFTRNGLNDSFTNRFLVQGLSELLIHHITSHTCPNDLILEVIRCVRLKAASVTDQSVYDIRVPWANGSVCFRNAFIVLWCHTPYMLSFILMTWEPLAMIQSNLPIGSLWLVLWTSSTDSLKRFRMIQSWIWSYLYWRRKSYTRISSRLFWLVSKCHTGIYIRKWVILCYNVYFSLIGLCADRLCLWQYLNLCIT